MVDTIQDASCRDVTRELFRVWRANFTSFNPMAALALNRAKSTTACTATVRGDVHDLLLCGSSFSLSDFGGFLSM